MQLAPFKAGRTARRLKSRTQRGGEAFRNEVGIVVADFATLFIDRVPEALAMEHIRTTLELISTEEIRESFPTSSGGIAGLIGALSAWACRLLPGCDEVNVSVEVATRLGTSVPGAHAWMIRPLLLTGGIPAEVGLRILEADAQLECETEGDAADMLKFYPEGVSLFTGVNARARTAINRGCKVKQGG